ncbi:MAG TPA: hypothetical protein VKZ87_05040 [Ferrovibrio sp.]|uniref:hypothetical protein n=1 Tax=Ferrovibrio sp. TaxID=1917215 RepID=UPI002B4AADC6|nr:hypothetical protein [Ferrovibrio sp.]HLT76733.1 hypothetical protein [Ferrovibrio sp.]
MTLLRILHFPAFHLPAFDAAPLLRLLAGGRPRRPEELEDWQLRDLGLTRPWPGPGRLLNPWLP